MKFAGKTKGFTIVEMLTVMGIIAILIGLLIPALNQVKDYSKQIQQKAQFHSIDPALEMFKNDLGAYPDSFDNRGASTTAPVAPLTVDTHNYGGAQKLADALVGWDLLGFHPKSGFRSDGMAYFQVNPNFGGGYVLVYDPVNGIVAGDESEKNGDENLKNRRKYINMEGANASRMQDVYNATLGDFLATNYVICDVYARQRTSGVKTGMPILYFKARTNYTLQDYSVDGVYTNDIYNYDDNRALILLKTAEAAPQTHELENTGDAYTNFEKMILNQQVLNANPAVRKPYRADSYILISAGKDGIYGTSDDIFNFEKGANQ